MYANHSPFAPRHQRTGSTYSRVGMETDVANASPHRLVSLLFDGLNDAMMQAMGAIMTRNNELKNRSLCRAVRIIDEGLKAALNMQAGSLAQELNDLYAYLCMRLTQANLHSDLAAIEECQRLIQPVREAWASIGNQAAHTQRAA